MRKESPCATIIKCMEVSSHREKEVSEWVKNYKAKNAARGSARERAEDSVSKAVLQFEKVQQNKNGTVSAVQVPKTLEK